MLLLSSFGLECLVNCITRNLSGTCIDHCFVKYESSLNAESKVFDADITDHSLIMCKISWSVSKARVNYNDSIYEKIDYNALNNSLDNENWFAVYNLPCPDMAFDLFMETLQFHLNNSVAYSTHRNQFKLKPWMTDKLALKVVKKNKLLQKTRKHPNNKKIRKHYKSFSKSLNMAITLRKRIYYNDKFSNASGNAKKQWSIVNDLIGRGSSCNSIANIIDKNNQVVNGSEPVSNAFNIYFSEIATSMKTAHFPQNHEDLYNPQHFANNCNSDKSLFFKPILPDDLLAIINSLKNKSSTSSSDGISELLIKRIPVHIVDVLSYIFNRSLITGIFPSKLKRAIIIPLFKKGDPMMLNNYRPICLLSIFSKIFEKAVKKRLTDFLDDKLFFSGVQFGFRDNRSTEDAIQYFLESVYDTLNRNMLCLGLFVDITKAFDMVVHKILLLILESLGIRGVALNWFKSYLSDRVVQTKVGEKLSDFITLNIGVPQGSVLGPLLFLVYINSMLNLPFCGKLVAFADDVAFCYAGSSSDDIIVNINTDLCLLSNWFDQHCLVLSDKTKTLQFNRGANKNMFCLDLSFYCHAPSCSINVGCSSNCIKIDSVTSFKYLGLILDSNLNWKEHCSSVKQYIYMSVCRFFLIRSLVPADILRTVYFALIQSKLSYGLAFWGGCYESTIKPVAVGQNFIVKVMCFKKRRHSSWPLYSSLMILPLKHLYVFRVLRLYFSKSGNRLSKILKNYSLRKNNLCYVPRTKYTFISKCFLVTAPRLFNSLPDNIKLSKHLYEFCNLLKDFLFKSKDLSFMLNFSV